MSFPCPPPSCPAPPPYPLPSPVPSYRLASPVPLLGGPSVPDAGVVDDVNSLVPLENYQFAGGNAGQDWRRNLPPGMKFRPTDEEVVVHYLRPFAHGFSDPGGPIIHADIYDYEPHQLLGLAGVDSRDGKMYFCTNIKKIGKSKTDRSIKSKRGYWKPTQAPKAIKGKNGNIIGYKTPLAYYHDKKKTQWLMQEFKLESHNSHNSCQEVVVVKVYYFDRRKRGGDNDDD